MVDGQDLPRVDLLDGLLGVRGDRADTFLRALGAADMEVAVRPVDVARAKAAVMTLVPPVKLTHNASQPRFHSRRIEGNLAWISRNVAVRSWGSERRISRALGTGVPNCASIWSTIGRVWALTT